MSEATSGVGFAALTSHRHARDERGHDESEFPAVGVMSRS
jgi:hypothetical protein